MKRNLLIACLFIVLAMPFTNDLATTSGHAQEAAPQDEALRDLEAEAAGAISWVPLVYHLSPPGVGIATNLVSDGTNIGINTASPHYPLDVNGGARINGALDLNENTLINADASSPREPGNVANKSYVDGRVEHTTGILIPMYVYPSDIYTNPVYNHLIDLKKTYHDVPVYAIINPASGPGTVTDGNYRVAIDRLHGAGIIVVGYVHTSYTARPIEDIQNEIDLWQYLYPAIDGIFYDEMTNDDVQGHIDYYAELTRFSHDRGLYPTIGNPGAGTLGTYFENDAADVIVIHENGYWPSEADLKGDYAGGYAAYDYNRRAGLVYGQASMDLEQLKKLRKYLGLIYVTEDTLPNPWDSLTGLMEDLLRVLSASDSAHFTGSVRIGSGAAGVKLRVDSGDVALSTQGTGLILRAVDGPNCFRLSVDNTGALTTSPVTCP